MVLPAASASASFYDLVPAPGLAADAILVLHWLIVMFVLVGQALILAGWARGWNWVRQFWFRLTHLITIGVVAAQAWLGRLCPLTIWEHELRLRAGQATHSQSFIEHWAGRMLFFDLPGWVFVLTYSAFAAVVACTWWLLPPRWPGRRGMAQTC